MGDHIIGEIGEIFTFGSHTVKVADRESEMVFTDGLNLAAEFRAVGAGGGRTLFAYLAGASVHSGCLPGNSFGIVGQIIVGGGSRSADFQFQSYLIADDISGSAPFILPTLIRVAASPCRGIAWRLRIAVAAESMA